MAAMSFLLGAQITAGLIIGVGPQNLYVLHRATLPGTKWAVPLICLACDSILTAIGVFAIGGTLTSLGLTNAAARLLAGTFILSYGIKILWGARKTPKSEDLQSGKQFKNAVVGALAVSLLNPAVYLDTLVILGSLGATLDAGGKTLFVAGATFTGAVWFAGITFLGGRLEPHLKVAGVRKLLDIGMGLLCVLVSLPFFFS